MRACRKGSVNCGDCHATPQRFVGMQSFEAPQRLYYIGLGRAQENSGFIGQVSL